MLRRFMVSLLVVFLLAGSVCGCVLADSDVEVSVYFNDEITAVQLYNLHPSANVSRSGFSQTFNATSAVYLAEVHVWVGKTNSPYGHLRCRVEGTGNSLDGAPNGTVYDTSPDVVDVEDLGSGGVGTEVVFNFSRTYQFVQYQVYAFVVYVSWVSVWSTTHYGSVYYDGDLAGAGHSGVAHYYNNSVWNQVDQHDIEHEVWGSNTAGYVSGGGEGGGTSSGGGSGGSGNTWSASTTSEFYDVLVIIAFLFGPALVLALLGFGKWGFLGGFTVGAVALCTCVNVVLGRDLFPSWGLFGVFLVDVGAVWGSAKGVF